MVEVGRILFRPQPSTHGADIETEEGWDWKPLSALSMHLSPILFCSSKFFKKKQDLTATNSAKGSQNINVREAIHFVGFHSKKNQNCHYHQVFANDDKNATRERDSKQPADCSYRR